MKNLSEIIEVRMNRLETLASIDATLLERM